ncbi:hypothetical protein WJX73_007652 [Symbiochloris irregularis]|uniref:Aminotransferase class I/classII large domain-containing protein n=1 Tax=Symbiochloris irregularis TaxID=706552 RepID=A0AAW1PSR9_9CHLO
MQAQERRESQNSAGPSYSPVQPAIWSSWVDSSLTRLETAHLIRHLRPVAPSGCAVTALIHRSALEHWARAHSPALHVQPRAAKDVVTLKLFSLNDYLGLSTHPKVCKAIAAAALDAGNGPRSSALVGGYTTIHEQLERTLASLKGTQDCLLLAARSGARLQVYRHNDLLHLDELLQASDCKRKLVVTDSLFSMDGDFVDLQQMVVLKQQHGFLLVIDEAHATLVCGPRGAGAADAAGVSACVDVHVGTLSKAAGCHGGFVACSSAMRSLLLNRGRSYVFSTILPVPVVAGALAAIHVACTEETWRRRHLARLTQLLGQRLGVRAESPIIPLIIGCEERAMAASSALLLKGFHVPAIRPPTVPAGTSRLRISLSAAHSTEDVESLARAILTTLQELDLQAVSAANVAKL